jgi:glutamate synthase (NADPH/NADH) large chain
VNFMTFIAEDIRELMAQLGFRTIEEMVGRTIASSRSKAITTGRPRARLLQHPLSPDVGPEVGRFCQIQQDHGLDKSLDMTTLSSSANPPSSAARRSSPSCRSRTSTASVGTITSGEITRKHGAKGLPEDTIRSSSRAPPARASAPSSRAA